MNYYNEIKEQLLNNEIYKKVKDYSKNKSDLQTYYNIGEILVRAQGGKERAKYGNNLIEEYSKKLTNEIGHRYTPTRLKYMRQFYLLFEKSPTVSDQLLWSHYVELLSVKNINALSYYIDICINNNLSVRELRNKIKSNEYERLDNITKEKLINKNNNEIGDFIKNPIVIKSNMNKEKITEKILHQLILENLDDFLKELGSNFTYVGNEYKIKIGNRYNYIDLLLFNIEFNCYVVVELKVTELKKEHIGQVETYMNYINKNIKELNQDKTIGIIICKKDNEFIMEYCSDPRIFKTTFLLQEV